MSAIEVIQKWKSRYEHAQAEARVWKDAVIILHQAVGKYLEAKFSGGEEEIQLGLLYQAAQAVRPTLGDRRSAIAYQEAVILRIITQYGDLQRSSAVWSPHTEAAMTGMMNALLEAALKWYVMMKEHEHGTEQAQPDEPEEVEEEQGPAPEGGGGVDADEGNGLHGA